jgi:dolichol-phosphate mannosyltransferase
MQPLVSIVIPIFNEEASIEPMVQELDRYAPVSCEFIFADDGSTDHSFQVLERLAVKDARIRCVSLSRNFGHQYALLAGLHAAAGQQIIILDGDLQHPPALIPAMLEKLEHGFDIVHGLRQSTQDSSPLKRWMASGFYRFINAISDVRVEPGAADFKAFTRQVLDELLKFPERDVFLRGLFSWMGFRQAFLPFDAPARLYGKSKYSFGQMLKLALRGTTSLSFKPLRVALLVGSLISLAAFAFGVFALIAYFRGETVPGWASLIIATLLLGGTQLLAIGLLGEYIASLFTETKQRPRYIVRRTIN